MDLLEEINKAYKNCGYWIIGSGVGTIINAVLVILNLSNNEDFESAGFLGGWCIAAVFVVLASEIFSFVLTKFSHDAFRCNWVLIFLSINLFVFVSAIFALKGITGDALTVKSMLIKLGYYIGLVTSAVLSIVMNGYVTKINKAIAASRK